jgi:predicted phosphodiesterase
MTTQHLFTAASRPLIRHARRPRVRQATTIAAVSMWLLVVSVAGATVALRGYSGDRYRLGPAEVSIQTSLATEGTADVYVPIVDWGIRAHPFTAPLRLQAQVVSIDRRAAIGALQSPGGAGAGFGRAEDDAPSVVGAALERGSVVALLGSIVGGAVGGLVLFVFTRRRLTLVLGAVAGVVVAVSGIAVCAAMMRSPDYAAFRTPTFYAHGGELPKLLRLSDQLTSAGAGYESSYQQALSGLDTLIGAAAGGRSVTAAESFLVGSDIHANWLTLPAFGSYADHRPAFLVGDFTNQGSPIEAVIAQRAAHLGHPTIAVSGNHDTPLLMQRLAAGGAIVLTHNGRMRGNGKVRGPAVQKIDGMLVAGYEDPLEAEAGSYGHRLDFTDTELRAQELAVDDWFDTLSPRPQIVLVHDFRIAAALRKHVAAESDDPLIILTGHDHKQHVDRTSNVVEIDGGTLGAGGVVDIGNALAGFAQVHLDAAGWPEAVDLIAADPISGDATAKRIRLVEQQTIPGSEESRPPPPRNLRHR